MTRPPALGFLRHRRWRRAAALVVAAVFLITGVSAYGFGATPSPPVPGPRSRHHHPPAAAPAELTIGPAAAMTPVPRSYLGLSTEYWALPAWAPQTSVLERVLDLLKVPGGGPFVLRVGGDSADHSFWTPREIAMPPWAYSLEPDWLSQARQLVAGLGIRLILDLNLITDTPAMAAQWARAAEARLPRGSIIGFEVGNEPDIYTRAGWLAITSGRQYLGRPLPRALTSADYVRDFRAYSTDLRPIAPGAMLAGPALSRPQTDGGWVRRLIAGDRRSLGLVTVHRYPYSACAHRGSGQYPTIGRILSATASAGVAASIRPAVAAARAAGLPSRMTEVNSVTCGGRPGVSDAFATALWAPDVMFDLLRTGLGGVNLHVRADTVNAPFALTPGGLVARPLLYGLVFFARALGPHARLLATHLRAAPRLNLRADAVRVGSDALHVVLIDKGPRPVRVMLRIPAVGPATVQRLQARSAAARWGVTLGGQRLGRDGLWQGAPRDPSVSPRSPGRYTIELHAFSAALVDVRVAPGALAVPRLLSGHSGRRAAPHGTNRRPPGMTFGPRTGSAVIAPVSELTSPR